MLTLSPQPIPTSSFLMSRPGESPLDPNTPLPVRIPKLAVRNRIEGLEPPPHLRGLGLDVRSSPASTQQTPRSAIDQDDSITPVVSRTRSPVKRRTSTRPGYITRDSEASAKSIDSNESDELRRPWSPDSYDPSSRSMDMSRGSVSIAPTTTKKSGMFGFLKLQEPSTRAWEEYAELQKREQALRGSQGKALPEKKLPDTVPKVNSKWNGLPDHAQPPKGKAWKSSMDLSRTTLSRATRHSEEKGSTRPTTAQSSGRSSTSSGKTARKTTSRLSDTPSNESSKSKKTVTSRTVAAAGRVGPAMSTASIEPPPTAMVPSSIPASSLFFPAEPSAPKYTSQVSLNPSSTSQSELNIGQSSPSLADFPKVPHSSPQVATPEILPTEPEDTPISSEEATPTQEQASEEVMSKEHQRTISDISLAPASPITPEPGTPLGPHNYHNRFAKKQSKSVELVPQWPLPTKTEEDIHASDVGTSSPNIPNRSHLRPATTSTPTSPIQPAFNFTQSDGPSDDEDITPTGSPAMSPMIDSGLDFTPSPPIGTLPSPRTTSPHLIPPARLPGRVKTRPFDLDTIAESDAGSVRAPSLYLSPHMSTTELRDAQAQAQNTGTELSGRTSLAASRASSEMSAQWHMTPKERLGLGGLIKQKAKKAPWPESIGGPGDNDSSTGNVEEGGYFVGMDGNWTANGERKEKKGLMGRLRR
jgi:hypothetical protein